MQEILYKKAKTQKNNNSPGGMFHLLVTFGFDSPLIDTVNTM